MCWLRADSVTETDQIDFQVPSAWNRFGGFDHICIESRITEYSALQHKRVPDIYELAPVGDVVLHLNVTAKTLSSCSLKIPSQWSIPIQPVRISVGRWRLELASGGLPIVFIKSNCFNRSTYVITDVTCVVADMEADYRITITNMIDLLRAGDLIPENTPFSHRNYLTRFLQHHAPHPRIRAPSPRCSCFCCCSSSGSSC